MGWNEVLLFTQDLRYEVWVKRGVDFWWILHYNVITKEEG